MRCAQRTATNPSVAASVVAYGGPHGGRPLGPPAGACCRLLRPAHPSARRRGAEKPPLATWTRLVCLGRQVKIVRKDSATVPRPMDGGGNGGRGGSPEGGPGSARPVFSNPATQPGCTRERQLLLGPPSAQQGQRPDQGAGACPTAPTGDAARLLGLDLAACKALEGDLWDITGLPLRPLTLTTCPLLQSPESSPVKAVPTAPSRAGRLRPAGQIQLTVYFVTSFSGTQPGSSPYTVVLSGGGRVALGPGHRLGSHTEGCSWPPEWGGQGGC